MFCWLIFYKTILSYWFADINFRFSLNILTFYATLTITTSNGLEKILWLSIVIINILENIDVLLA